jgi:hypothetical protein
MRYLGLVLYAEGPTDHRFLPNLIRRTVEDLCLRGTDELVNIGDVLEIHAPAESKNEDGKTRILHAAREVWEAFDILFVHTDAGGDWKKAMRERIEPVQTLLVGEPGFEHKRLVGIVPNREMEAWALVDGDALRAAFGTTLSDKQLGVPAQPREVESISDPKQALEQAYAAVVKGRRPKSHARRFLDILSEQLQLDRLARVPTGKRFVQDLEQALIDLHYIDKKDRG